MLSSVVTSVVKSMSGHAISNFHRSSPRFLAQMFLYILLHAEMAVWNLLLELFLSVSAASAMMSSVLVSSVGCAELWYVVHEHLRKDAGTRLVPRQLCPRDPRLLLQ